MSRGRDERAVGLGSADDPAQHIGKICISFHNIQDDSCVDSTPKMQGEPSRALSGMKG
jgi:hypothetical protein